MTNSTTKTAQAIKTSLVNNETFTMLPTYAEMDDQVLMHLSDQMLRELGGSRNVNSEIEFILKHADEDYENAPFCRDDITNNEPTAEVMKLGGNDVTMTEEEKDAYVEELEELLSVEEENEAGEETLGEIQNAIDEATDQYCEDYPEIMQWFAMDDRIMRRLEEMGECTLSGEYWGRCAFGQAITMDHCIKRVCYDLAMCWAK
jgi:hypothetical protein